MVKTIFYTAIVLANVLSSFMNTVVGNYGCALASALTVILFVYTWHKLDTTEKEK